MIIPHFLSKGATIGLVSPAGRVNEPMVRRAVAILAHRGYNVIVGKHAMDQHNQMAGTDVNRLDDLQHFMDRADIDAIFCIRGGYGTIRIIDRLSFTQFNKWPKWVVGFSDITTLHMCLQNVHNTASIHGMMPKNYPLRDEIAPDFEMLLDNLSGRFAPISTESHPFNRLGKAEGQLIGGNLSLIHALRGTPMDFDPKGKILFIEDVNEYIYRIDRMMHNLKIGGILKDLSGLIVGQFTEALDNEIPFGQTEYEIIQHLTKDYSYPILFNFPSGHTSPNYPLALGMTATLEVTSTMTTLTTHQ